MLAYGKINVQPHNAKAVTVWNSTGGQYNDISRGLAGGIEHAINRLGVKPGERVLDLACATGWVSRSIADQCSGAEVFGLDIGSELVESAKSRAAEQGLKIDYRVGDAEMLPYENDCFDAVISTWGVMFAGGPENAAAELGRVVKKSGRIVLTTWKPDSTVFEMFTVMKAYMPAPPSPPPPSPFAWGRTDRVRELLASQFDLKFEEGVATFYASSPDAAYNYWITHYGPTKTLNGNLEGERRMAFKRDFIAFHEKFKTDLGVAKPRQYLLTYGVRK
jgi:SAM-dependent methyltransferase